MTTFYSVTDAAATKLRTSSTPGHIAVTDLYGNGQYVELSSVDRRELALELLSVDYDLRFYPGPNDSRRIDAVLKQKPVRTPHVGEFYRIPGKPGMAKPWCDSPVAKVVTANSRSYITLEAVNGDQTGWSDIRALGDPLKVTVKSEWAVEEEGK